MDYKELIERLKYKVSVSTRGFARPQLIDDMEDAATAIETLLAEREAALEDLHHGGCDVCKYIDLDPPEEPCAHCYQAGGTRDYWEWRGPQEDV